MDKSGVWGTPRYACVCVRLSLYIYMSSFVVAFVYVHIRHLGNGIFGGSTAGGGIACLTACLPSNKTKQTKRADEENIIYSAPKLGRRT